MLGVTRKVGDDLHLSTSVPRSLSRNGNSPVKLVYGRSSSSKGLPKCYKSMPSKILLLGAVNGHFRDVLAKIGGLHAKNNFSYAIVAGSFFADPATATDENASDVDLLLSGEIRVPLPTYFMLGTSALPQNVVDALEKSGGDVCENLHFLGKRATTKTIDGTRIVVLGGKLDGEGSAGTSKDNYTPFYSVGDAKVLRGARSADILITSEWPDGIQAGSKNKLECTPDETPSAQTCLSELCSALKPRYHISTSSAAFYEREPFSYPVTDDESSGLYITRFISLASFGNQTKQKWIYAFTLDLSTPRPNALPAGTTASPFVLGTRKRPAPSNGDFQRFSSDTRHEPRRNKRQRQPLDPSQCFFCISNPNVAQHLITSIGEDAYLTTAKGPLSARDTYPDLDFPCHILIIPMAHAPTLSAIPDTELRKSTMVEMQRYRSALHGMISRRADNRLGTVTWEVSRSRGVHTHWQLLPMPVEMISKGLVEAAFKVQAENEHYPSFEVIDAPAEQDRQSDCFKLWIWAPGPDGAMSEKRLSMPLDSTFRFDLQFGRRVLAKLLGLEHRSHWRDCDQSEQEETGDAEAFKKSFETHDFSL